MRPPRPNTVSSFLSYTLVVFLVTDDLKVWLEMWFRFDLLDHTESVRKPSPDLYLLTHKFIIRLEENVLKNTLGSVAAVFLSNLE